MADKINLHGQKLKVELDGCEEVHLCHRNNRLNETPTNKRKVMQVGMDVIAPMIFLFFMIIRRHSRRQGTNHWTQLFADEVVFRRLDR
jgi:hypothetical protein